MTDTNPSGRRPDDWSAAPAPAPTGPTAGTATVAPQSGPDSARPAPAGTHPAPPAWSGTPAPAPTGRTTPRPPWSWPIVAVAVGLAALLVGGGVGFAVGHAVGGAHGGASFSGPGPGFGPRGQTDSGTDGSGN